MEFKELVKHETPTNLLKSHGFNSFVDRQNELINYIAKNKTSYKLLIYYNE